MVHYARNQLLILGERGLHLLRREVIDVVFFGLVERAQDALEAHHEVRLSKVLRAKAMLHQVLPHRLVYQRRHAIFQIEEGAGSVEPNLVGAQLHERRQQPLFELQGTPKLQLGQAVELALQVGDEAAVLVALLGLEEGEKSEQLIFAVFVVLFLLLLVVPVLDLRDQTQLQVATLLLQVLAHGRTLFEREGCRLA